MQLITFLGANEIKHTHKYKFKGKEVSAEESVEALLSLYSFQKVKVLVTEKAKKKNLELLEVIVETQKNIDIIDIDEDIEALTIIVSALLTEDSIIDVTASFRSIPFSTLISSTLSRFNHHNFVKDIVYARQIDGSPSPNIAASEFEYISIEKYLDIIYASALLSMFQNNYTLIEHYHIEDEELVKLFGCLSNFSRAVLTGNLSAVIYEYSQPVLAQIDMIKDKPYLEKPLAVIYKEITLYKDLSSKSAYNKLLEYSKKMYEKKYYSLAVTSLSEAVDYFYCETAQKMNKFIQEEYRVCYDKYTFRRDVVKSIYNNQNLRNVHLRDVLLSLPWKENIKNSDFLQKLSKIRNEVAHIPIMKDEKNNIQHKDIAPLFKTAQQIFGTP